MQKGEDARLLIILKSEQPQAGKGYRADRNDGKQVPARNTGEKHHAQPDERDNDGRAEVRLERDQHKHNCGIRAGYEYMADVGYFDMPAGKVLCQSDDERELYKLDRLERGAAEGKPRLAALCRGAGDNQYD